MYGFLKEMKVKGVLNGFNDSSPNASRSQVKDFLDSIAVKRAFLSPTEAERLERFFIEFDDSRQNVETTAQLFDGDRSFSENLDDVFSQKLKHLYKYRDSAASLTIEAEGHFNHGQLIDPRLNNSEQYDIGFRFHGTLFDHLGYNFAFAKGASSGSRELAAIVEPLLRSNFKFIEDIENINNYDFAVGYLRYYSEPFPDMDVAVQIGREKLQLGYGYGSRLVFSGEAPNLDFIKVSFDYGVVHFTSIHASAPGRFSFDRNLDYTKFLAINRFRFTFDDLFDFGIGEMIVYSDRGIDLAYLNPLIFYKYSEMSLQDRDNGLIFLDLQTNFLKGIEFTGTFFLDENIMSNMDDLTHYSNKTAYQIGTFIYEPFAIPDLSVIAEYTRIRPYVYTHTNPKNTYSTWDQGLGHRIGPNADELFASINYQWTASLSTSFTARFVREGRNVTDENGNVIQNVGSDIFLPFRPEFDNTDAQFLAGSRVNTTILSLGCHIEPVRDFYFDITYDHTIEDHLYNNTSVTTGLAAIRFTFEY